MWVALLVSCASLVMSQGTSCAPACGVDFNVTTVEQHSIVQQIKASVQVCTSSNSTANCLASIDRIKQGLTVLNATVEKMLVQDCPSPQMCQLELSSVQSNIGSSLQALDMAISACTASPLSFKCLGKLGSLTVDLSSVAGALSFATSSCGCGSGFPPLPTPPPMNVQ